MTDITNYYIIDGILDRGHCFHSVEVFKDSGDSEYDSVILVIYFDKKFGAIWMLDAFSV